MSTSFDKQTYESLLKTMKFAAEKHAFQKRKSTGASFIIHPCGVADDIVNIGGVTIPAVTQAALLHDVLEDTPTTAEELTREFGEQVCGIVKEVTDDKSLGKGDRKRLQIEHAAHISYEAKLVKLSDKLYNVRNLIQHPIWDDKRTQGYVVWAHAVVEQMRGTNTGLEGALDEVFSWSLPSGSPALPSRDPVELKRLLEEYLREMSELQE